MIFRSLVLKNIRSYTQATIVFPQGRVLLSGDIGSGKSTILLAIEFALFGTLRGMLDGSMLLRAGETRASVTLTFSLEDKDYTIHRELKLTSTGIAQQTGSLTSDFVEEELSAIELKTRILSLLGYPQDMATRSKALIYRYTVYTSQEKMKEIIEDEARMQTLRIVFDVDKYRRIVENTSIVQDVLREKIMFLEGGLLDPTVLSTELLQAQQKLDAINIKALLEKKEKLSAQISYLEVTYKSLQEQLRAYEAKTMQLKFVSSLIEQKSQQEHQLTIQIQSLTQKINALPDKLMNVESLEQIYTVLQDQMQKYTLFSQQQGKQNLAKKRLDKINEQLLKKKNDPSQEILTLQKDISIMSARLTTMKDSCTDLQSKLNRVSLLTTCPVCLQTVDATHKQSVAQEITVQLVSLEKSINEMKTDLVNKNESQKSLLQQQKEYEAFHNEQLQLMAERKQLQSLLDEPLVAIEPVSKEKIVQAQQELVIARKIKQDSILRETFIEQLKEKSEQIVQIKKDLTVLLEQKSQIEAGLTMPKPQTQEIEKKIENTRLLLIAIEKEIGVQQTRIEQLQHEIIMLKQKDAQNKERKQSIIDLDKKRHWLKERFIPLMQRMEQGVLGAVHTEFSQVFSTWFSMLITDETITVRLDEEFTPIIIQNGHEMPVESLSGGEKTSVALAYRLALNKVINDVLSHIKTKDVLILDEPTDGFSTEQLDRVRDVLEQLSLGQLLIVSHEPKVEHFVDHILKVRKINHVSDVA